MVISAVLVPSWRNCSLPGYVAVVRESITGLKVFGGIVLNRMAGGLNAAAVEAELALGAKEVWLPIISAVNHIRYHHGDLSQACR